MGRKKISTAKGEIALGAIRLRAIEPGTGGTLIAIRSERNIKELWKSDMLSYYFIRITDKDTESVLPFYTAPMELIYKILSSFLLTFRSYRASCRFYPNNYIIIPTLCGIKFQIVLC